MTSWYRTILVAATAFAIVRLPSIAAQSANDPFKEVALDPSYESGSPDGRLVVYRKPGAAGRAFLKDLGTGTERTLVDLAGNIDHFAWSPDSRQLAFGLMGSDKKTSLQVVDLASGAVRTLGAGTPVGWRAGDIVVSTKRNGWPSAAYDSSIIVADSGGSRRILSYLIWDNPSPQVFAVAGTKDPLFVVRPGQRLLVHDEVSQTQQTITSSAADETLPVASPDGRMLAFASDRDGEWALYVVAVDQLPSKRPLRMASLEAMVTDRSTLWWTADGRLALGAEYAGSEIYKLPMNATTGRATGSLQRLTTGAAQHYVPIISPDSRLIAYHHERNAGTLVSVGVIDANGGPERRLSELGRDLRAPAPLFPFAWRSANSVLIYRADGTAKGFASLDVSTGAIEVIADADVRGAPVVRLATGELLYGVGNPPDTELRAVSLSTRQTRVFSKGIIGNFCATRDGLHVAVSVFQRGGGGELRLVSASGDLERVLLTNKTGAISPSAFSPDGQFLLYFDEDDAVRILNVASGVSWALIEGEGQPDWSDDRADWSPDGSFIVIEGVGTWRDTHVRAWDGVTYKAVTDLLAASGRKTR